jgi:hypothetical protein
MVVIWWWDFLNFQLVFSRTAKNRLISSFSLFKIYLLLDYISECSINLGKDGEICFCYFDGAEFKIFCWILENLILVNRKWKLGKWKSSDLVESTTKLKLEFHWSNLLTAFWYLEFFWSKSGFQCFPKKNTQKNSEKNENFELFFGFFFK